MNSSSSLIIGGDYHLDVFDDAAFPDSRLNREDAEDYDSTITFNLHMEDSLLSESLDKDGDALIASSSALSSTVTRGTNDISTHPNPSTEFYICDEAESQVCENNDQKTFDPILSLDCTFKITPFPLKAEMNTSLSPRSQSLNHSDCIPGDQYRASDFKGYSNRFPYQASNSTTTAQNEQRDQKLTMEREPDNKSHVIPLQEASNDIELSVLTSTKQAIGISSSVLTESQAQLLLENSSQCFARTAGDGSLVRPIQRRRYRLAKPSKYCHICARNSRVAKMLSCHNVLQNFCQKSVCLKCISQYSLFQNSGPWVCPHCKSQCPARARCHTYNLQTRRRKRSDS